jgi:hypothetical protein
MYSKYDTHRSIIVVILVALVAFSAAEQLTMGNKAINATLVFKPTSSKSHLRGSFNLYDDGLTSGTMVAGSFHSGLDTYHRYLFIAYSHSTCDKLTSNRFFKFDVTHTFSYNKLNKIGGTNFIKKTDFTWFWGQNVKTAIVAYRNTTHLRAGDEEGDIDEDIYARWRKFGCANVKMISK